MAKVVHKDNYNFFKFVYDPYTGEKLKKKVYFKDLKPGDKFRWKHYRGDGNVPQICVAVKQENYNGFMTVGGCQVFVATTISGDEETEFCEVVKI